MVELNRGQIEGQINEQQAAAWPSEKLAEGKIRPHLRQSRRRHLKESQAEIEAELEHPRERVQQLSSFTRSEVNRLSRYRYEREAES